MLRHNVVSYFVPNRHRIADLSSGASTNQPAIMAGRQTAPTLAASVIQPSGAINSRMMTATGRVTNIAVSPARTEVRRIVAGERLRARPISTGYNVT